jgi:imidazoleglycerol-phosphate dehydratase
MAMHPRQAICIDISTVEDHGHRHRASACRRWVISAASNRYAGTTDDAQVRCVLDLSGRPYLICNLDLPFGRSGPNFDTELVRECFRALSTHGGITLHRPAARLRPPHHRGGVQIRPARCWRSVDPRKLTPSIDQVAC